MILTGAALSIRVNSVTSTISARGTGNRVVISSRTGITSSRARYRETNQILIINLYISNIVEYMFLKMDATEGRLS